MQTTACSRGLRWAKADVKEERKRHRKQAGEGSGVLEFSECFILREKPWDNWKDGLAWGQRACMGTDSGLGALASRQVKEAERLAPGRTSQAGLWLISP